MYLSDDVKLFLGQCDNQFTYLTVADMRTLYRGNCLNDQVSVLHTYTHTHTYVHTYIHTYIHIHTYNILLHTY